MRFFTRSGSATQPSVLLLSNYTVVAALLGLLVQTSDVLALWPMPTDVQQGSTALKLSPGFQIKLTGTVAQSPPADLVGAVAQTHAQLFSDRLERLVPGGGAVDASQYNPARSLPSLTLQLGSVNTSSSSSGSGSKYGAVRSIAQNAQLPLAQRDESYTLVVPSSGAAATLTAPTTLGLYRGLTTFAQLWYTSGNTVYTLSTPVTINDKPAYAYRGLMLDTARNFFPVKDILRTLDGMSMVKSNTFHWHIVDSQSFPLVVPQFPELSAKGAYSQSQVYSPSDVKTVVDYAGSRGIDVMMEIDTPGHTAIIAESHPEFVACPGATPWATFANEPPAGQLRLAAPAVLNFTASLFRSVAPLLPGKYFSTGGDEINQHCYDTDNTTQLQLRQSGQTFEQALSKFVVNGHQALRSVEMVLAHNVTLANDTLVMVWISSDNAKQVAEKGFQIIHAPSDYFYLDCGHGGWVGDFPAGNSWCDPFKTWQKAYSFDPLANITDANAHLVVGGQQLLWTEQSSPSNLDSTVWPRAAASAEVFWTGSRYTQNGTSISDALARMHALRYRMVNRGIAAIALQPHWCAVRPHACDLTA